mmetsp:Transcript_5086/g.8779  ORF Transcript_5086/g.8779 Transcript_5086/m.8779 type:complete len:264 (-) Transcript_5086:1626-2417(-)
MGSSCSASRSIEVAEPPVPPSAPSFMENLLDEDDSDTPAARWNNRRRRRRRQQLRDEARLAEILALQQSLAAMEDFFQSLLGQAQNYMEAMDPQQGGNAGPPPASELAIKALPQVEVHEKQFCGICGEGFGTEKAIMLPCGHHFHAQSCVEPWLKRHCTCPVCRYELPTDDDAYEEGRIQRMSSRKLQEVEEDENKSMETADDDDTEARPILITEDGFPVTDTDWSVEEFPREIWTGTNHCDETAKIEATKTEDSDETEREDD